jgi:ATP-dependent HslUV protease ATP-binding subunit HslU
MDGLTCSEIVQELDKYIIGQNEAKKSVAIAIRNRFRRLRLKGDIKEDVLPKNIIMIGPTGVGKSEIARRLAKIIQAPFLKVEATKFTEIGYIGRNVESMVRDLTAMAYSIVKNQKSIIIREKAEIIAKERIIDVVRTDIKKRPKKYNGMTIDKFITGFNENKMNEMIIEVPMSKALMPDISPIGVIAGGDFEELNMSLKDMFSSVMKGATQKTRKITVINAYKAFVQEEIDKMLDLDEIAIEAINLTENSGIIFLDEIDKIIGLENKGNPNVSREGVQRDLLPIVEGTTVKTKFGDVNTHHILFIAAGAFHLNKPSDLIPELQGRFPLRVTLDNLNAAALQKILIEPKNCLIKQYEALLEVEKVKLKFTKEAIKEIAKNAFLLNEKSDNIGARRLYAMLEKILEDISFEAPYPKSKKISISKKYISDKLKDIVVDQDLSKYIL